MAHPNEDPDPEIALKLRIERIAAGALPRILDILLARLASSSVDEILHESRDNVVDGARTDILERTARVATDAAVALVREVDGRSFRSEFEFADAEEEW